MREGLRERGVVPPLRDPARHFDDAQGSQRLAERERRAVELAKQLVALEEVLTRPARFLGVAAREEPEVLDGRADEAVVEVDKDRTVGRPEDVALVEVAVNALYPGGGERRRDGVGGAQRDVAVA